MQRKTNLQPTQTQMYCTREIIEKNKKNLLLEIGHQTQFLDSIYVF